MLNFITRVKKSDYEDICQKMEKFNIRGICYGASIYWIMDIISNQHSLLRLIHPSRAARYQRAYYDLFSCEGGHDFAKNHVLKSVEYQLRQKKCNVKQSNGRFSSRKLLEFMLAPRPRFLDALENFSNIENMVAITLWSNETRGHVVALYRNKNNGSLYIYSVGDGIAKWNSTAHLNVDNLHNELAKNDICRGLSLTSMLLASTSAKLDAEKLY